MIFIFPCTCLRRPSLLQIFSPLFHIWSLIRFFPSIPPRAAGHPSFPGATAARLSPHFFFLFTRWEEAHAPEVAVRAMRLKQAEKIGRDYLILKRLNYPEWGEGDGGEQNHFSARPRGRTPPRGATGGKQKDGEIWMLVAVYLKIKALPFLLLCAPSN